MASRRSTSSTRGSGRTIRAACSKTGTRAGAARPKRDELASTELTISSVAKTGNDVALLVQALVKRGDVYWNIGVRAHESAHPFRRRDDADIFDPPRSPLLQHVDGRGRRSTRREHRVEHEADLDGRG